MAAAELLLSMRKTLRDDAELDEAELLAIENAHQVLEEELLSNVWIRLTNNPTDPFELKRSWQTLWTVWGARAGQNIEVSEDLLTKEELADLKDSGGTRIYVPPLVARRNRKLLPEMFSFISDDDFQYHYQDGNPTVNRVDQSFWVSTWLNPLRSYSSLVDEEVIRGEMRDKKRFAATLNSDIVARAFDSFIGKPGFLPIESTRLLGSHNIDRSDYSVTTLVGFSNRLVAVTKADGNYNQLAKHLSLNTTYVREVAP